MDVLGGEADVEGIVMRVPLAIPVMDPERPTFLGVIGLKDGLTIPAKVIRPDREGTVASRLLNLSGNGEWVCVEDRAP
jgi:hypothetical protein